MILMVFFLACQSSKPFSAEPHAQEKPMQRQLLGRISENQPHHPYRAVPDLRGKKLSDVSPNPLNRSFTSENALVMARANLEKGKLDEALYFLECVRQPKHAAEKAHLLAIAHLQRAENGQALDALAALHHASSLQPKDSQFHAAQFNRALALEKLHLDWTGRLAWNSFLKGEQDPHWQAEAHQHLNKLEPSPSSWQQIQPQLFSWVLAADQNPLCQVASAFPQALREEISFQFLLLWADWLRQGQFDRAASFLDQLQELANMNASISGDQQLADYIQYLRSQSSRTKLQQLAEGHLLFCEGRDAYDHYNMQVASEIFAEAGHLLRESPFHGMVEFHLGVGHFRTERQEQAVNIFNRLLASNPEPVLKAHALWMLGLYHHTKGRYSETLNHYYLALDLFRETGELQNQAAVLYLIAQTFHYLGDEAEKWTYFNQALALLPFVHRPKWQASLLNQGSEWALKAGLPLAALELSKESIARTMPTENALHLAESYIGLLEVQWELDQGEALQPTIDQAQFWIHRIEDPTYHDQTQALLDTTQAKLLAKTDPAAAISYLDRALSHYREVNTTLANARLRYVRGEIHRDAGNTIAAKADFEASLKAYEMNYGDVTEKQELFQYFDQARDSFDQWALLEHAQGSSDSRAIFEKFESLRSVDLHRSLLKKNPVAAKANPVYEGTLLRYLVLPNKLLLLLERQGSQHSREFGISAKDLKELTDSFVTSIAENDTSEINSKGAELYTALIAPVETLLEPQAPITLIPDMFLFQIPFSALIHPSGSWLFESYPLAQAPSRAFALWSQQRLRQGRFSEKVFAVANPSFNQHHYPDLPPLTKAAEEVDVLKKYYGEKLQIIEENAATIAAIRPLAQQAGLLHLAVHSQANTVKPFESWMLLAPEINDPWSGKLTAKTLETWQFPATRLVVLASCHSGAGRVFKSEGLISLAMPFLNDGTPAAITNLWKVQDTASATFFKTFYHHYHQGLPLAVCLQKAQTTLLHTPKTQAPYFWAGFTLVGE